MYCVVSAPNCFPHAMTSTVVTIIFFLCQGTYISWFSGEMIIGPQIIARSFALWETPVYAREGAIIPMRTDNLGECILSRLASRA